MWSWGDRAGRALTVRALAHLDYHHDEESEVYRPDEMRNTALTSIKDGSRGKGIRLVWIGLKGRDVARPGYSNCTLAQLEALLDPSAKHPAIYLTARE